MNKTLFTAILFSVSFNAVSQPYVGVEYGFASTSHDSQHYFPSDPTVKLDPSNEDGILSGFIGYSLTPHWSLEFAYSQFNLEDDRSRFVGWEGVTKTEEEWEATIKATQFSLAPVYTHSMNDKWLAKMKVGVTYTRYDVSGFHYDEHENEVTDVETIIPHSSYSDKSNKIGGLISAGTEYKLLPQLTVGANVKYQFDGFANTTSFNIGSTYYF